MFISFSAILAGLKQFTILVSYLSNANSFPQPLTAQEEGELLTKCKLGDDEARNALIERNLRLVAHIAKKYSIMGKDNDDLISIGTIGLIKAVGTFNKDKGTRLATYAARCIENEILMSIRAGKKNQNEVYLQEPIGVDREGNEISLLDIIPGEAPGVTEEVELKLQIKKLYEKMKEVLKKREKVVIELRYGLMNGISKTQKEIASMLGISRSYVSRIEKKAIKKLSEEMKLQG
ncbi:MAG: RNA polymerase sporulation sigma factor SigK [Deltaproteobacteria bacterium]